MCGLQPFCVCIGKDLTHCLQLRQCQSHMAGDGSLRLWFQQSLLRGRKHLFLRGLHQRCLLHQNQAQLQRLHLPHYCCGLARRHRHLRLSQLQGLSHRGQLHFLQVRHLQLGHPGFMEGLSKGVRLRELSPQMAARVWCLRLRSQQRLFAERGDLCLCELPHRPAHESKGQLFHLLLHKYRSRLETHGRQL